MGKNNFALALALLFVSNVSSASADEIDISRISKDAKAVRAFIGDFVNDSGQNRISGGEFRKIFEGALLKRRSMKFEIAKSAGESDVQISASIKKYLYSKTDPVTTYASPSGLLLDAVTTENYAMMKVEFTVVETRTGKVIWQKIISDFVKHTMTPEESIPMVCDKVSRTFLWKCFGKSR